MTRKTPTLAAQTALCAAVLIADDTGAPEWVHLLPAGAIHTHDGRGPYRVASMAAIAGALRAGEKLPLDECHSTDKAAPLGLPAPARGWIVELQARADGLWGRVEWTEEGQRLMAGKAYRGISPVIMHSEDNRVLGVLRASLTNTPNLVGLTALHSEETSMDWKAKLIELLGLDGTADDDAIEAALSAKMTATAPQSAVIEHPAFVALQSELTQTAQALSQLQGERKRDAAVAFIDAAIAEGRVGLKPVRDEYIGLHMQDPATAQKLISAMAKIEQGAVITGEAPAPAASDLDATDRQVIALMGINEDEYRESLKASGQKKEAI